MNKHYPKQIHTLEQDQVSSFEKWVLSDYTHTAEENERIFFMSSGEDNTVCSKNCYSVPF